MAISDNDKRWLVTLVASNKFVAPVLRNFANIGMDKLYTFLDGHLNGSWPGRRLQTLTYPICHPPTTCADPFLRDLKFENINDNFNLHGRDKIHYNYNVKSSEDLAKLYLPHYLALFSGFDNSMDMSAVLNLLVYNNYPTQIFLSSNPFVDIESLADDVKANVRNPGAHYNESDWTEKFFNQCFDKLEALVKGLVLPAAKNRDTLDRLSQWRIKGNRTAISIIAIMLT